MDVNSLGFSNNAADDLLTVGQIQPWQGLEQLCRSHLPQPRVLSVQGGVFSLVISDAPGDAGLNSVLRG